MFPNFNLANENYNYFHWLARYEAVSFCIQEGKWNAALFEVELKEIHNAEIMLKMKTNTYVATYVRR